MGTTRRGHHSNPGDLHRNDVLPEQYGHQHAVIDMSGFPLCRNGPTDILLIDPPSQLGAAIGRVACNLPTDLPKVIFPFRSEAI